MESVHIVSFEPNGMVRCSGSLKFQFIIIEFNIFEREKTNIAKMFFENIKRRRKKLIIRPDTVILSALR